MPQKWGTQVAAAGAGLVMMGSPREMTRDDSLAGEDEPDLDVYIQSGRAQNASSVLRKTFTVMPGLTQIGLPGFSVALLYGDGSSSRTYRSAPRVGPPFPGI